MSLTFETLNSSLPLVAKANGSCRFCKHQNDLKNSYIPLWNCSLLVASLPKSPLHQQDENFCLCKLERGDREHSRRTLMLCLFASAWISSTFNTFLISLLLILLLDYYCIFFNLLKQTFKFWVSRANWVWEMQCPLKAELTRAAKSNFTKFGCRTHQTVL